MKSPTTRLAQALILLVLMTLPGRAQSVYEPYTFITFAGSGPGFKDGALNEALFFNPSGVAFDSVGNLYVADSRNNAVRKISPLGEVTTMVNGSMLGGALLNDVAVDGSGNIFLVDFTKVKMVTQSGAVTILSGLSGYFDGVAVDSADSVYVADQGSHRILKRTPAGVVTILTKDLLSAYGMKLDSTDAVYVADLDNNTICKVLPTGRVMIIAGKAGNRGSLDGVGAEARFDRPLSVALDKAGNIYVTEAGNRTIRKVTPNGVVTTLAGVPGTGGRTDGIGSAARFGDFFGGPRRLVVDNVGNIFAADSGNNTIRKGFPTVSVPTIVAGSIVSDGGKFGFNVNGPVGQSVVVDASTDLQIWQPLQTNTITGIFTFTDSQPPGSTPRFYRARLP